MDEFEWVKSMLKPSERVHIEYEYEVYKLLQTLVIYAFSSEEPRYYLPQAHKYLDRLLGDFFKPVNQMKRHAIKNTIREFYGLSNQTRYKEDYRTQVRETYIDREPDYTYLLDGGLSFSSNYNTFFKSLIQDKSPIMNPVVDMAIRRREKLELAKSASNIAKIKKPSSRPSSTYNTTIKDVPDVLVRKIGSYLGGNKRKSRKSSKSFKKNKKQSKRVHFKKVQKKSKSKTRK